jgi:hypothetical protein
LLITVAAGYREGMKHFKFTLRDLFWLVLLAALATAWWLDGTGHLARRKADNDAIDRLREEIVVLRNRMQGSGMQSIEHHNLKEFVKQRGYRFTGSIDEPYVIAPNGDSAPLGPTPEQLLADRRHGQNWMDDKAALIPPLEEKAEGQ